MNSEEQTGPRRAASDTDPGRPALDAVTLEQEAVSAAPEPASKKASLRARLGAPRPAEEPSESAPTAIGQAVTADPTEPRSKPNLRAVEPETSQTRRPRPAPAATRPAPKRIVSNPGKPSVARRRPEATDPADDEEPAQTSPRPKPSSSGPRAGQPLVQPGKYGQYMEREPDSTMARPELQKQPPPAAPPVNPDEALQSLLAAIKLMSLEDKLECFGAVAMIFMTFMPWRELRGDSDLGIVTTAGFFSLLLAGAALGLMYLRFTGRVPTLPAKLLSKAELGVIALQLPITLVFIVTSVDRHETHIGSLTVYASMPDFGAVLSMIANFVAVAGAALIMQREARGR